MCEDDMARIAQWIVRTLRHPKNTAAVKATREEVTAMCRRYPVPGIS
jgi:glycine/serine hydroxymethyltransferase